MTEDVTTVVSEEDFYAYLDVQHTGLFNMMDVKSVCMYSDLSRTTVFYIMNNYSALLDAYGDPNDENEWGNRD